MNYTADSLASNGLCIYPVDYPVMEELLGTFQIADESVADLSKHVTNPEAIPQSVVQNPDYEMSPLNASIKKQKSKRVEDKYSDIESFFIDNPHAIDYVTDLSKKIDSTYKCQNQPMQLTSNLKDCYREKEKDKKSCPYSEAQNWIPISDTYGNDKATSTHDKFDQLNNEESVKQKSHKKENRKSESHKCDICHKKLSSVFSLKDHLKIHTGRKPFGCEECGHHFTTKSNLCTHLRIHSGEKPFSCKFCQKRFAQGSHLKTHIKLLHMKNKLTFKCSECKKKFSTRSSLNSHKKIHSGNLIFSCDICDKRFSCKSFLLNHQKVHSNDKKYGCDVCGKKFKCEKYIKKHKKKFCNNFGYLRRWQVEGAVSSPGRKRKFSKYPSVNEKRIRGRPKSRKAKVNKSKRQKQIERENKKANTSNSSIVQIMENHLTQSVPLALINQNATDDVKPEETQNVPISYVKNLQVEATNFNNSKSDSCSVPPILDLNLSENILDFTKDNSSIHCFSEPENLTLDNNSIMNLSSTCMRNEGQSHDNGIDLRLIDSNDYILNDHTFGQPQNLSLTQNLPQNLSLNQPIHQNLDSVEPQNLSHPHKMHSDMWNLPPLQPENLSQPQNLSLPQSIEPQNLSLQQTIAQPQNLSQPIPEPQNLSQSASIHHHNIHQNHMGHEVHISHIPVLNNSSHLEHHNIMNQTQDFSRPQNLTMEPISHRNHHTQNQPQNLSLPQNLSFSHIHDMTSMSISQPQNLSIANDLHSIQISQPQNLSIANDLHSIQISQPQNLSIANDLHSIQSLNQPENLSQPHLSSALNEHAIQMVYYPS